MTPVIVSVVPDEISLRQLFDNLELREPTLKKIAMVSSEFPLPESPNWTFLRGEWSWARNVNLALERVGNSDAILLSGTRLCRSHSVDDFIRTCTERPDIGVLSAQIIGQVSNPMQNVRHQLEGVAYSSGPLELLCCYLPHSAIERTESFNENLELEGYDVRCCMQDFCQQIQSAGLRLAVTSEVIARYDSYNWQMEEPAPAQAAQSGVTLITATGGRPEAFSICRQYVERQTFSGPLQWIIVDDCEPSTVRESDFSLREGNSVVVLHPIPSWKPGQNTLARNLLVAMEAVAYNKVLFIEDDDNYSPTYIDWMAHKLDQHSIVGEIPARYYNVAARRYLQLHNEQHASLCQTGIQARMLPKLKRVCEESQREFIDIRLWDGALGRGLYRERHVVGIKGLPGRPGIGIGHNPHAYGGWNYDANLSVLRSWIGNDMSFYYA